MKKAILFIFLMISLLIQIQLLGQNTSLSFNGFNNYATITDFQNVDLQTNEFTIEAWVRGESSLNNGHSTVFSNRVGLGGSSNTYGISFGFHNQWGGSQYKMLSIQLDGINYLLIDNGNYNGDILDGNCHHIAISRENELLSFYVDGLLIGEQFLNNNPAVDLNSMVWIGNDPVAPTSRFNGEISEVRIWNNSRTESEIFDNMNVDLLGNSLNLTTYWKLDEGSGQIINDQVGNTSGILGESIDEEFSDPTWLGASICDLSFNCPGIVLIEEIDICGIYNFEIADAEEMSEVSWNFGDGEIIENGNISEIHEYDPGFYSGIVTYSSTECTFISIPFYVNVLDCEAPCDFEIGYEQPWCENYFFQVYSLLPNDYYSVDWFLDGQFIGQDYFLDYSFLEEGVYNLCAILYSANCEDGLEVCETIVVNYENCNEDCPTEVMIQPIDGCSLFVLSVDGDETGNVDWDFGDGTTMFDGGLSIQHDYEPGIYYGDAVYYSETCEDIYIPFTIEVEDCNNCDDEIFIDETDNCGEFLFEVGYNQQNISAYWDFGDGQSEDSFGYTFHLYEEPGVYFGYVWYTSNECPGMEIFFTIVVEDCEGDDCTIEMYWEELTCEYYSLGSQTNNPDAVITWTYDGVFLGTGPSIDVPFPTEGIHVVCASYETPECPIGVEVCHNFDIDYGDCNEDCPTEVMIQSIDGCSLFVLSVEGDETGNVDWDFGDGTTMFDGGLSIQHDYEPGIYYGDAVYYSETCDDFYIPFIIEVEDCEDCENNPISMTWSVAQWGSDQGFNISLFEVGEDLNSLEYIDSGDCFASDFGSCEFDNCLDDGCYAYYISSSSEFDIFDFDLSILNDDAPVDFIYNGFSPTVGFYVYFSLGNSVCAFEDNCILDFGYEILEDGTYIFSALTNSTADVVWDFGDGTTGTGWPVEHVYAEPGDYEVCVTFADNELCSNDSSCGTVTVINEEECTNVAITIGYDLPDEEIEMLEFSILYQGLEIENQIITLPEFLSLITLDYCLEDGCYAFELIPSDPIYDLSGASIAVAIPGNPLIEGTYDEATNSITLLFGVNDDACATSNIAENSIGNLLIYPNPVENELNIQIENNFENLEYKLVNVLGQVVKSGQLKDTNNKIYVNGLSEGQYQLVISNNNLIQTRAINIIR